MDLKWNASRISEEAVHVADSLTDLPSLPRDGPPAGTALIDGELHVDGERLGTVVHVLRAGLGVRVLYVP